MNRFLLRHAARVWNIQPSYRNTTGEVVWASSTVLQTTLKNLTKQRLQSDADLRCLIEIRHAQLWERGLEPVLVAWAGELRPLTLYLKDKKTDDLEVSCQLLTESGEKIQLSYAILQQSQRQRGCKFRLQILTKIPEGYHQLEIQQGDQRKSSLVISSPEKIHTPTKPSWGPFLPLYALRSDTDWGCGSFKELREALQFVAEAGAQWVATLPLLAGRFESTDCDPSPYSALTRLFWNEIFLDVEGLIAKYNSPAAGERFRSQEFQRRLTALRETSHVDYFAVYSMKKEVLDILAEEFFDKELHLSPAYMAFVKDNPEIENYAKFRSADVREQDFHKFVQFEMNESLRDLRRDSKVGLYLDFPVGVNDSGFDFEEFRQDFFAEVSVGAPPEPVFRFGQDWGFPAFHPFHHRESHYVYFRKSLKNHLKHSKILRLDHVMGLYRVYCVPKGWSSSDGVYLRFPREELFAICVLETSRAGADLIGENLGTVPLEVDQLLNKREIKGMWVWQMALEQKPEVLKGKMAKNILACVNTHDMPMLRDFEESGDLERVKQLGILTQELAENFKAQRRVQLQDWHRFFGENPLGEKFYTWLAELSACYFVLNIEDVWGEKMPQNIPGTWKEYPNWRRKFSYKIKQWAKLPALTKIFAHLKKTRS